MALAKIGSRSVYLNGKPLPSVRAVDVKISATAADSVTIDMITDEPVRIDEDGNVYIVAKSMLMDGQAW